MKREEILAMEAGNELNYLVSLKIMGQEGYGFRTDYLKYSTDFPAAWQVVEKMLEQEWVLFIDPWCDAHFSYIGFQDRFKGNKVKVRYEWFADKYHPNIESHEMPEAICKAALLAKLEDRSG